MKTKQRNTRKKNKLSLYAALVLFLFIHYVVFPAPCALGDDILPRDPSVQAGDPTITSDGRDMTVNAGAYDKTWIDWQGGFNIGAQNSVNNLGPSSAAVILHNDVTGVISDIQGALNGNCNVFLLNPSGIIFGQGAQVNVGGLVVSTLNMSMDDFMSGDYKFKDENLVSMSAIVNSGIINSQNPSGVTLIAGAVRNEGIINANLGTVNLVSGKEVTLNINSEGSIQVAVNKEVLSNVYDKDGNRVSIGVDNVGDINANGGQVYIEAEAAQDVFDTLINQSGVVKAGSMVEKDGKIVLVSNSEGIVQNTGTLDASAIEAGVAGGDIEMTGSMVGQFGTVKADAINGDGGNIDIYARDVVALSPGSLTTANAGLIGDGGTIIIFSPDTALFWPNAQIEAKGGSILGDGGFVEVSGKEIVEFRGLVDTSATNGTNGILLLDPFSIDINVSGDANGSFAVNTWTPTSDASVLTPATLLLQLNANTVIIDATVAGGGTGQITITSPIDLNTETGTLRFQAETSIDQNAAITNIGNGMDLELLAKNGVDIGANITASGTGNITINADSDGTNTGAITVTAGTITMAGGDLRLVGGTGIGTSGSPILTVGLTDVAATSATGGIFISNSGSGDINITTVTTVGVTTTTSGNISVTNSAGNITTTNVVTAAGAGTVTLDATLANATITVGGSGDIDSGSGLISLLADGDITLNALGTVGAATTGAITITADQDGSGAGTLTTSATTSDIGSVAAAGAITITANQVALSGDIDGVSTLTLQPSLVATSIGVGGGVGTFNLDDAEIALLSDGFTGITIGRSDGTGAVDVGAVTFTDPLTILSGGVGGTIAINGALNCGANALTLTAGGAISDAAAITATTLTVKTKVDGGAAITLDAGHDVDTLAASARNTADTENAAGAITFVDTDGLALSTINTLSTFTLTTGAAVTQTGAVTASTFSAALTAGSLDLGTLTNTINNLGAITAPSGLTLTNGSTALTLTGTINTSGSNGAISINVGTANLDTNDQTVEAGSGTITFTSDRIDLGTTADTINTTGTLNLYTNGSTTTIGIGGGNGDYNLTDLEIAAIDDGITGTLVIGNNGGSGAVDIDDITFSQGNVTIYGGAMSLDNLNIGAFTLILNSTGAITDTNAATSNITATTANITAYGGIGSADALETAVTTLRLINNDVIASTSAIQATNTGTLTLNGATNYDAGNITVIASSPLTVSADVITTGNGAITLTATEDGASDDTLTVNANITIQSDQGTIALNAGQNIDLGAGVLVQTGGDGTIDLNADDVDAAAGDGDIIMNATALIRTTGTGAITLDADDDLTITNITSAGALTIDSNDGGATGIISLNGNVTNTSGTITFSDAVSLTGASVVSSTNGNVTFTGTVNGAATLEADADNGTVTFSSTIGDGADPTAMTLNADTVVFNNSVSVAGNIDINANNVTLDTASSGSFITSAGAGYIDFGTALIDSAGEAVAFVITTDTTGNVVLGTVGSSDPVASLAVTSGGSTTLNGNITADGAAGITFTNAVNVLLANNVTLTTNTSTGDVVLDSVNGAKSLTVNSVGDITLNDDIGGTVNLTSVTLNAADVINVNAGGDITSTGAVSLHTTGDAATDDINLAANVIGSSVTFDTTGGTPGDTVITATQNNSTGSTTYEGKVEINGAITLTSLSNMTFNGAVTTTAIAAGGITSTNGSLDFNADLSGGQTINLNAANGGIALNTVGAGADPTLLDLDSLTAELSGAIGVVAIDTTGVGLTTLAADFTITASGAAGILLGDLDGAKTLTLIASSATGVITLLDADIDALSITDADAVNFNGNFVTSGAVTVGTSITNDITVANTGSIQAGGNIGLDNTAGAGTFDIVLNGNVSTTGSATITISADDAVNIAQTAASSVSAVNGEIDITTPGAIALGTGVNAGQIVTTGTGLIDINNTGALTMGTASSTKISGGGGVDINGASSIAGEVMATNAGNVLLTGAVTLVGNTTVGSDNGNVTFTSTVGGAFSLAANAPNGIVTFSSTVGAVTDELTLLTVTANEARLAGNISTDGGTTADIDFRGTSLVTLTAAVILDTETGDDQVPGDVLFGTSSSVVGAFGLTVDAGATAGDGNFQINDADVGQFTISAASVTTATLYGTILSDNAIDLSGAATITLADTASLQTTVADQDITIGTGAAASTLNGAHPLTVTSTGDVSFDVVNALTELIVVADTVDFTDTVSMPGDITVNTWTAADLDEIDVQAAFDSTNGSITFTGRTELNNAAFSAGQNITLNSDTVITTGVTITADNGYIDLNAAVNEGTPAAGTDNLTLTAPFGTVYARQLGTTKSLNVLDVNALAAELAGNITAVAVDATGVGLSTLTADITITASGAAGILLSDLDGAKTLTLIASHAAGVITLLDANIGALSITDSNTVNFNGNFVTSGAASVTGVDGEIDVAAAGSVQSGGSITFTTTGAGTVVDINGPVSSDVDISFDASTAGTISVDSTVTARGIITMLVDVDLNINAAVNSTMAGNIIMTADIGDINLSDEVRTTSTGDVSLTATLGSIIDADVATEDERIAGDVVTLTALENIGTAVAGADIDTEANSLDVSSTDAATARTIVIDEYDAVVLTDIDAAKGSITVSADGLITATDVNASGVGEDVTLTTTTGGMILTSVLADDDITATADAGDITIALVGDAGTDDIAITATTGAIDEVAPEDVGVDIVGDVVTLTAQNGIGHARKLETTIASLDASVTSTGDIQIAETDAIILTDLDTVDGSITVSAGGLITATDVNASGVNQDVTLTTTAGGIVLTSVLADDDIAVTADAGDITIDVAGDAGTDDLTITATTGSINGVDIDAAAEITGDAVVLTAQDEIGGASGGATEIETEVTTISADSTAAGDIIFEELDAGGDGINLLSIDTNNGNIIIVTNGVTHEAGTETIITSVKSDTGVAGANDISITASTGDITLAGNATDVNNVQSDDDITIIATVGSITEDASVEIPGDSYVDIQGDKLTITARDEIGSSTGEYDIETTIANLDASSTTAGDIIITETNAIGLDDVDTANGAITIVAGGAIVATDVVSTTDADANDITITATAGDVTIGVITAGAGVAADASITATAGSINEIGAGDAAVDITADALTLSCQDEIGGVGELDIETTVNSFTASSTLAGATYITETNAITLTSVTTTDGLITIISGGNMTVTSVTAGGDTGSNDDVTLTTTAGDIIMSGDITALNDIVTLTSAGNITDTTSGATDISAADLVITANAGTVGAIGANNELDTDVDTITAAVNGAIYILEDSAVSLPSVVTVAGLIDIEAAGTITTTTVTASGGFGVDLYATAGNLLDTAGGMIIATAESNLKASGVVGTNANPMDVNIDGKLWILAGSMQDEVSANVAGTVNGGDATERVEILLPAPPGLVLLDNHLMGGGNYGSGSTNGTILSRGYGYTAIVRADMFSSVYQQGLQPWGHNMMLPWVLSEGAVIDDNFLNNLPGVIDISQLNLPVLNGNQTANFYVIRSLK